MLVEFLRLEGDVGDNDSYPFDIGSIPEPNIIPSENGLVSGEGTTTRVAKGIPRGLNNPLPQTIVPAEMPSRLPWNHYIIQFFEKVDPSELMATKILLKECLDNLVEMIGLNKDCDALDILLQTILTHSYEATESMQNLDLENPFGTATPNFTQEILKVKKPKLDPSIQKLLQIFACLKLINIREKPIQTEELNEILTRIFTYTDDVLLLTSRMIRIPSPPTSITHYDNSQGRVRKGASFQVVEDSSKGLNLVLPPNVRYEEIKILRSTIEETVLEITEKTTSDGKEKLETYQLSYGNGIQINYRPAIKVTCTDSGSKTFYLRDGNSALSFSGPRIAKKPVIYIRNFEPGTSLNVSNRFFGSYDVIYPTPTRQNDETIEWNAVCGQNNMIIVDDNNYPYLFWDGKINLDSTIKFETGLCIHKNQVRDTLEMYADINGLDDSMKTDFVTFWAPLMMNSEYYLIKLLTQEEINLIAELDIQTIANFELNRMYFAFKPVNKSQQIKEQDLSQFKFEIKDGPAVIEWGGFEI